MVDYKKCTSVTGFNSKQLWVYDEENDMYIDPPAEVLDEIDSQTEPRDWEAKEVLLDEILETNPDWLQDEEYTYSAEDFDI